MSHRPVKAIVAGACAALVVVAWIILAPAELGGSLNYVTTSGDSMEPSFQNGDLALLRVRDSYEPGDAVAYRHPEHGLVLHRIVDVNGDHFIVKGDNNTLADAYEPSSGQIVGKVWARIPAVGGVLTSGTPQWLRFAAAAAIGLFALVPLGISLPARRRASSRRIGNIAFRVRPGTLVTLLGRTGQTLVTLTAFLALAGLLLAFVAYNRALERQVSVPVVYEQRAILSYSASATGSVYAGNVVNTGDPIYRALVDELTIHLNHEVSAERTINGDGDYWIDAVVEASDGWQHTIPLRTNTRFAGTSFSDTVILGLDTVDAAIEDFREQAGLASIAGLTFKIHVLASVSFDGTITSEIVRTVVSSDFVLRWNPDALYLDSQATSEDGLVSETIESSRTTANSLELGFLTMSVQTARMTAQIMLFAAVAGGLLLWFLTRHALQAPEPLQIAARYRSRIVPIQGARIPTPARVVALLSFDDLMRIADQKQEPILHFSRNGDHYYYVQAVDVIYRVKITSAPDEQDLVEPS